MPGRRPDHALLHSVLGLAAFAVVGCHAALAFGAPLLDAASMGMVTATGGGIICDMLTITQPMILPRCSKPRRDCFPRKS
ncbi:TRIC cation channel family protein [Ruegeria sediminis]|uniref:TRIC cation channel family protein n=1 Tax=Ruegeria sediminis TaxID=2583820 RepID=UPI0014871036